MGDLTQKSWELDFNSKRWFKSINHEHKDNSQRSLSSAQTAYASKGLTLGGVSLPEHAVQPYLIWLKDAAARYLQVFVNPYTGQVMGDRQWESS